MTLSSQDSDASLNFSCPATLNFSTPTAEDRELEMLIIAYIQTLKPGNKKCRKDKKKFLGYLEIPQMTSPKKLLTSFWNCWFKIQKSVKLNIVGNRECLSLPKENQKLRENDENQEKPVLMEDIGNLRL